MSPQEVNALLTKIAVIDSRFSWAGVDDRVAQARVWSELLEGVELVDAEAAVVAHYRESRERVMPADIVARCAGLPDRDAAEVELEAWLAARGVSRAEFERLSPSEVDALVRGDRGVTT